MRFGELFDPDTGALERRIPVGGWLVLADLKVKGDHLLYRPHGKSKVVSADNGPPRLLEDFLALANGSNSAIESYARKHGVLGLCSHGLPAGHESLRVRLASWLVLGRPHPTAFDLFFTELLQLKQTTIDEPCFPATDGAQTVLSEPISLWRLYASLAVELLTTVNQARDEERHSVADTLDDWLSLVPLRPCCVLDKRGRLTLQFRPVNPRSALFGVLGLQVFFAASGSGSLLICAGCGRPYMAKRLPRTGTHTYCPKCGIKAAWRQASRRYYERKKRDGTQTQRG